MADVAITFSKIICNLYIEHRHSKISFMFLLRQYGIIECFPQLVDVFCFLEIENKWDFPLKI